jgi:uncharacterized protein involved in type VI secretion and phage assembly
MNDAIKYWGKWRGLVTSNDDPENRGRIQVKVPDVLGDNDSTWALPCVPYAGSQVGLFLVPPEDALVWVEFEQGNPDYPIWTGCFWAEGDVPEGAGKADVKMLKTSIGTLTIDDSDGSSSITIETTDGLKIVMDSNGISLSNSSQKIVLSGDSVSINDGALEVQ